MREKHEQEQEHKVQEAQEGHAKPEGLEEHEPRGAREEPGENPPTIATTATTAAAELRASASATSPTSEAAAASTPDASARAAASPAAALAKISASSPPSVAATASQRSPSATSSAAWAPMAGHGTWRAMAGHRSGARGLAPAQALESRNTLGLRGRLRRPPEDAARERATTVWPRGQGMRGELKSQIVP